MVSLGVSGSGGVAAVLGVAAVVCVSSAVAGELLQDFKVGFILGGTPRNIQIAELLGRCRRQPRDVFPAAACFMRATFKTGGTGFGDRQLPAPQAGLMALLAQGIVGGDMPWPLVLGGHPHGLRLYCHECEKPHAGGRGYVSSALKPLPPFLWAALFRWFGDMAAARRGYNERPTRPGGKCRRAHRLGP